MKTARILANILVAVTLIVILASLVINIAVDRSSKAEDTAHPKGYVQDIPFK